MRVLLLADPGSIHTVRWACSLNELGVEIIVFGLGSYRKENFPSGIKVHAQGLNHVGLINKLKYLTVVPKVKKLINQYKPDIVHAHYATSYGLLGRLSGFKPFLISVWGSDIFEFPNISFILKWILQSNLRAATKVLSTSHIMAQETKKFLSRENPMIEVIPFGIDLKHFVQTERNERSEIVIGTVKTLTLNYGIDTLINGFYLLSSKFPNLDLRLVLVGEGDDRKYFESLVEKYKMQVKVKFLGKIEHSAVPQILNDFDIFVALSNNESFGVSIIEASACGLPVVVTNVGGLPEVVENRVTGLIVNKQDAHNAAAAFEELVLNQEMRRAMGVAGRLRVEKYYDWESNVRAMIDVYNAILNQCH